MSYDPHTTQLIVCSTCKKSISFAWQYLTDELDSPVECECCKNNKCSNCHHSKESELKYYFYENYCTLTIVAKYSCYCSTQLVIEYSVSINGTALENVPVYLPCKQCGIESKFKLSCKNLYSYSSISVSLTCYKCDLNTPAFSCLPPLPPLQPLSPSDIYKTKLTKQKQTKQIDKLIADVEKTDSVKVTKPTIEVNDEESSIVIAYIMNQKIRQYHAMDGEVFCCGLKPKKTQKIHRLSQRDINTVLRCFKGYICSGCHDKKNLIKLA